MMRRGAALLCALALLAGLAACGGPDPQPEVSSSPTPSVSLTPSPTPEPTPSPTAEPTPEPTPTAPAWEEDHTLDRNIPKLTGGLELPVTGATGYAAVEIGLWAAIPTATPTPTPTATPTPIVTPTPAPTPSPAVVSPTPEQILPPVEETGPVQVVPEELLSPTPLVVARTLSASAQPTPAPYAGALAVLSPGSSFTILAEKGGWWKVSSGYGTGWVEHRFCMINLPDVIPSILYDATNAYASRYTSSGKDIPGVTGKPLYSGKVYNPRFDEEQFLMPVLYATAKKICAAQQQALAQGNSLKLYEAYRPYAAQRAVVKALTALAERDPEVKAGITTKPWSMTYFINTGYSNHQKGFAVDVSLVKVTRTEVRSTGGHSYLKPVEYQEYEMPTPIHELSMAAASTTGPGETALADTMNDPAIALRGYFRKAGMTPLESEWWHFNDYSARALADGRTCTGSFEITRCRSTVP